MNFLKGKIRTIILFLLGLIIASCTKVLADTCSTTIASSSVTYSGSTKLNTKLDSIYSTANSLTTLMNNKFANNTVGYLDSCKVLIPTEESPTSEPEATLSGKLSLYYATSDNAGAISVGTNSGWGTGTLTLRGTVTWNGKGIQRKLNVTRVSLGYTNVLNSSGYLDITSKLPSSCPISKLMFVWLSSSVGSSEYAFNVINTGTALYLIGYPGKTIYNSGMYIACSE